MTDKLQSNGWRVDNWPIQVYVTRRLYLCIILLASSDRKFQIFVVIFCVVVCIIFCHIRPRKDAFVDFTITVQSMMCTNNWVHHSLQVVFICQYLYDAYWSESIQDYVMTHCFALYVLLCSLSSNCTHIVVNTDHYCDITLRKTGVIMRAICNTIGFVTVLMNNQILLQRAFLSRGQNVD